MPVEFGDAPSRILAPELSTGPSHQNRFPVKQRSLDSFRKRLLLTASGCNRKRWWARGKGCALGSCVSISDIPPLRAVSRMSPSQLGGSCATLGLWGTLLPISLSLVLLQRHPSSGSDRRAYPVAFVSRPRPSLRKSNHARREIHDPRRASTAIVPTPIAPGSHIRAVFMEHWEEHVRATLFHAATPTRSDTIGLRFHLPFKSRLFWSFGAYRASARPERTAEQTQVRF